MRQQTDAAWASARYNEIRHRLPESDFPPASRAVGNLDAIEERYNTFVFDSFGVLNIGGHPIEGAIERIARLRSLGKQVFVLTNAASVPLARQRKKYADFGFDFCAEEIISSRSVLMDGLANFDARMEWSVIAGQESDIGELGGRHRPFSPRDTNAGDGIIFLSSAGWDDALQQKLLQTLQSRPRPFLIGNPDLVAPREDHFTVEPGSYAHEIADRLGIEPQFYGKPFKNAFDSLISRSGPAFSPGRTLMLGDTLHTDILGGAAAGLKTALVTDHGLLKGMDPDAAIDQAGIRPDYLMPGI